MKIIPAEPPAIEITSLEVAYDDRVVLRELSTRVDPGELVAVVGPNGSGKTTLLRVLAGLLVPHQGEVSIFGARPASLAARRMVSSLADEPALFPDLSIWEQAMFIQALHGAADAANLETLVEMLDVRPFADRLPRAVSKGQRQRAWLLLGLLRPFGLLLADEPLNSLDARSVRSVIALFRALTEDGAAIVASGHSDELRHAADRIIELDDDPGARGAD